MADTITLHSRIGQLDLRLKELAASIKTMRTDLAFPHNLQKRRESIVALIADLTDQFDAASAEQDKIDEMLDPVKGQARLEAALDELYTAQAERKDLVDRYGAAVEVKSVDDATEAFNKLAAKMSPTMLADMLRKLQEQLAANANSAT